MRFCNCLLSGMVNHPANFCPVARGRSLPEAVSANDRFGGPCWRNALESTSVFHIKGVSFAFSSRMGEAHGVSSPSCCYGISRVILPRLLRGGLGAVSSVTLAGLQDKAARGTLTVFV